MPAVRAWRSAGTCGKSTVTGLVAWLVRGPAAGPPPSSAARPRSAGHRGRGYSAGPEAGPTIAEDVRVGRDPHRLSPGISASSTMSAATTPSCRRCASSSPRSPRSAVDSSSMPAALWPPGSAARPAPASYGVPGDADFPLRVISTGPDRARGRARPARGLPPRPRHALARIAQPRERGGFAALVAPRAGRGRPRESRRAPPRFPGPRPPLRGGRRDAGGNPRRRRLCPQPGEDPRRRHHGAGGMRPARRGLSAARLRPRSVHAARSSP